MWEAHNCLQKRWLANKHNRKLKTRIAALVKEIEEHVTHLTRQQWGQLCERMSANLGLKDTWSFLRCLQNPENNKIQQHKSSTGLLHSNPVKGQALLDFLQSQYLADTTRVPLPPYDGQDNSELDADITVYSLT
ncbi:hypothetical protein HPB49_026529 [Dermacentor silvarum]|nr:hypothetical protein HPB49_026529 [Dermacentor silvarum]